MITPTTGGIDLAKSIFSVHGLDTHAQPVLHSTIRCDKWMLVAGP